MSCQGQMAIGVSGYENCVAPTMTPPLIGYPGAGIPNDNQYAIVSTRNIPGSLQSANPREGARRLIEACLRARGILYQPSAGTCGQLVPSNPMGTAGQIVGLSGTAASGALGVAASAGAISGAATAGIGTAITLAIAGIEDIFAHHAQAVANEQRTICGVANFFNPLMKKVDTAVQQGLISPDVGRTYVKQICNQAITGLNSILQQCNAACFYVGVLKAHADFVDYYYPFLSPHGFTGIAPQAPASAPTSYGYNTGGVPDAGGQAPIRSTAANTYAPAGPSPVNGTAPVLTPNKSLPGVITPDYLNLGYNQQTGQSAQYADVPNTTNWAMWGAIAAMIAAFVALISVSGRASHA